jgi:pimeloyl-ACP methyl ester carboxylesterase
MLAQHIALAAPERVSGLVLVDGLLRPQTGKFSWPALLMALPYFGNRIYTAYRRDPQAAYDSLRPFYANLDVLPEPDRQFLFQRVNERVWSDTQRQAYLELYRDLAFSAPRQANSLTAALAKLATPTRLVWGELDAIMPVAAARAFVGLHPGARLTVIPGAGHLPHQEQPAAFLSALASQPASQAA